MTARPIKSPATLHDVLAALGVETTSNADLLDVGKLQLATDLARDYRDRSERLDRLATLLADVIMPSLWALEEHAKHMLVAPESEKQKLVALLVHVRRSVEDGIGE